MKIGTRLTLTTVSLVVLTLGLYGTVTVRNRRMELSADSARRLSSIGGLARVAVESTIKDGLYEDLGPLMARWQATASEVHFTYIDLSRAAPAAFQVEGDSPARPPDGGTRSTVSTTPAPGSQPISMLGGQTIYVPPSRDPTRQLRLQRVAIEGLPYGEAAEIDGRPCYAVMEPIRDSASRIVGALDLVRDEDETIRAMRDSVWNIVAAVGGLGLMLGVILALTAKATISSPLARLIEAVGDVTRGDLGRVILRERDDEVGDLTARFNEMTGSLREARKEILAGVDAKLALEARLRHSEKLATIGQLAAGIAHEVGTPLNVIGGRARNMAKRASEALEDPAATLQPQDVAKNAGIIAAQTQRITKIIQQLLDFARRPQRARGAVDLGAVVRDTLDFLEHQLAQAGVEARKPVYGHEPDAPATPEVPGDSDQLQQVLLNLCVNAIQAMPGGGRLTVELRGLSRRRPGLEEAQPGRFVVVAVRDTGVGIPFASRDRIFEPFYSTKTSSSEEGPNGTGLGLAVSNGIVKDHDGWIEIDAPDGGGTVFRVFLPAE
jgi:two-component system NtrC family sensor kinase